LDWRCDIASGNVRRVTGRIAGHAATASRAWSERRCARLQLIDADGRVGQGEASPLPGYSPDTLEECEAILEAVVAMAPAEFDNIEHALATMNLTRATPAARFAVETALLDLVSQRTERSIASLLDDEDREPHDVPLAALCVGSSPAAIMAAARAAWNQGIRTIKLKIGQPHAFAAECELIAQVRHHFGDELALRLDANAAWNPDEAMDRLTALAIFAPELVEQPVAPDRMAQLIGSPVAIAADESLHAANADIDRLFQSEVCHVAVLKPMVIGGLIECRRIARLAHAQGVDTIVSHLFDGPIALAAAAELALSLPDTRACGLAPHAGLTVWPRVRVPQLRPNRVVDYSRGGLGVPLVEGGR
jgi:o-succinylbenzoate synthase